MVFGCQDVKNNPNVHEVGLQAGGMASNQWLISTLQTPFSGTLSQAQKGLILHNESRVTDDFANVRDQNNAITSIMSAGAGSKVYFDQTGRGVDYLTGTNYLRNTDGQGQFIANTYDKGGLRAVGYKVDSLALSHSLDNGDVKLNVRKKEQRCMRGMSIRIRQTGRQ